MVVISFFILQKLFYKHQTKHTFLPFVSLRKFVFSSQFIITLFSLLSLTLLSNADIVFVKKFFSQADTGIYGSWSLFAKIILYVVAPITQIAFVFFAGNKKKHLQDKMLAISLVVVILVGITGYIGYTYFGTMLITGLFGIKFLKITPYLGLASIFGTFYATANLLNTYFLAKKNRYALIFVFLFPLYIITLFFLPKNLISVMRMNIVFSGSVAFFYLGAFFLSKR